ncbi:MAG: hypothetical protein A2Y76_01530 [Planctomycetes bacterium RBG_13_60_9]|nr:MAG: hypothetical protein A2Y76_01530 [Planctomycetes bacterium RBG_13_60_9]
MTKDQARIVILEDALIDAIHQTEFLYGCLMTPSRNEIERILRRHKRMKVGQIDGAVGYSLDHPHQVRRDIRQWRKLVKVWRGCYHSRREPDCPACTEMAAYSKHLTEAKRVLGSA